MTGVYIPKTEKCYSIFDVASGLQKSIRRCREKEALYWAWELERSNYGEYLWKRLLIIAVEDVGPADPSALEFLLSLRESYDVLKKKKSGETALMVSAAVVYLARSPKSRLFDWAKCWMIESHEHHNLQIPSYALDIHTRRGRSAGKTIHDFFATGCKLEHHEPAEGEAEYMAEVRKFYCEWTDTDRENAKACKELPMDHPDRIAGGGRRREGRSPQQELFGEEA